MTRYLLAFLLLFSATAASAAQKDEQAIIDHGRTWAALYEAGKIDEMRPLYEEDAVLMTDGTPKLVGVAAILSFLGRNKERGNSVRMQFFNEDVKVAILLNAKQPNTQLSKDSLAVLSEFEATLLKTSFANRQAFAQSVVLGSTVHDVPSAKPAQLEVEALTDEILELLQA